MSLIRFQKCKTRVTLKLFLSPSLTRHVPTDSGKDPVKLETYLTNQFRTNVVGNVHLINLFLPLILKGNVKKIIVLSSGMADLEPTRIYNLYENPPYGIAKAALNMAVAKFSAEYAKHGVLFMSISPGVVDTGAIATSKLG